jgi:hypothetical protein
MNSDTLFLILTNYDCNLSKICRVSKKWKNLLYTPKNSSFQEMKRNDFISTNLNILKEKLIIELDKEIFDASHCYDDNIIYQKDWRENFIDWELSWYSFRECSFFYDFLHPHLYD